MSDLPKLGPWPLLSETTLAHYGVFEVRRDVARSPRTGLPHDFVVLDGPDWVNVVALTGEDEIVLVRQYRHGTRSETLEIPGGGVERGEEPLEAAKRELREETGYASDDWTCLGAVQPNPAIQTNSCHTFLARGARKVGEPEPDAGEDLQVEKRAVSEMEELFRSGAIRHALVHAAFLWYLLRQPPAPVR